MPVVLHLIHNIWSCWYKFAGWILIMFASHSSYWIWINDLENMKKWAGFVQAFSCSHLSVFSFWMSDQSTVIVNDLLGEARLYFYLAFQGKVKLQIFSEYAYFSVQLWIRRLTGSKFVLRKHGGNPNFLTHVQTFVLMINIFIHISVTEKKYSGKVVIQELWVWGFRSCGMWCHITGQWVLLSPPPPQTSRPLKIKAVCSFKILGDNYPVTWCYISEQNLHPHHCENRIASLCFLNMNFSLLYVAQACAYWYLCTDWGMLVWGCCTCGLFGVNKVWVWHLQG